MDGQEYLNQISASNRPSRRAGADGLLSSKWLKYSLIGAVALIIIILLVSLISGGQDGPKNKLYALKLNLDNTNSIVQSYRKSVKSSILRSHSSSFVTIVSNTSSELTNYLTTKYKFNAKEIPKNLVTEADAASDELKSELFEAKINGILDRVYAHKMIYAISTIMNREAAIINSSKDTALIELLTKSYNSLENIYNEFNNFSETTN